jgi:ATP-binding protein involved in chromosome partitioning
MMAPHQKPTEDTDRKIHERLAHVTYTVAVMSGKGGVGKTTVSVNLAYALAARGFRVGLLDIDIHGPNVPKMLGIEGRHFTGSQEDIEPVEVLPNLHVASIALAGYDPNAAFIWRGPIKVGLIRQFLGDVDWGDLDYLIIDTPPGTGDESLTIAQLIPSFSGAVIVTTPQQVAVLDSKKTVDFAEKLKIPVLGIVENMSTFVCPKCGEATDIFSTGGGKAAADDLGLAFLGKVPIEPQMVISGDSGRPIVAVDPDGAGARAFGEIVAAVERRLHELKDVPRSAPFNPANPAHTAKAESDEVPEAIRDRDAGSAD